MYVSYYIEPTSERRVYLCRERAGYYYYSIDLKAAHRFSARDAAQRATPVYDGNLSLSTGVTSVTRERLRCYVVQATPTQVITFTVLLFLAISGTIFLMSTFALSHF